MKPLDLAQLEEFHDRNTSPNGECGWCGGEMKGIHKIIRRADGVAISCAGGDAMLLAEEILGLRILLETATSFQVGKFTVRLVGDNWFVLDETEHWTGPTYETRDEAIKDAMARK